MYAGAPICSPSRAALLSGRFADATGVWDLVTPGASEMQLMPDALVIGNMLAQGGYACGQIGKWHVSHENSEFRLAAFGFERLGYGQRHGNGHSLAIDQADTIITWITHQVNASRKFMVYHDAHECHEPVDKKSPQIFRNKYGMSNSPPTQFTPVCSMQTTIPGSGTVPYCAPRPMHLHRDVGSCAAPSCEHCNEHCERAPRSVKETGYVLRAKRESWGNQKTYLGCISQVDAAFGKVLGFLTAAGLEDNTLVLFSSDNGPELRLNGPLTRRDCFGSAAPFRGWKGSVFEGGIRVPGLVRWPAGGVGSFVRSELHEPIHFVDILPTLADAAGISIDQSILHGASFLRLLREPTVLPSNRSLGLTRPFPLYWSSHSLPGHGRVDDVCARCDVARYAVRSAQWKLIAYAVPYDCRTSPMQYITASKLLDSKVQLFNLQNDPGEEIDLARVHAKQTSSLLRELLRTRTAVQAVGRKWDLDCQLPNGKPGTTIFNRPALTGLCRCTAANASGATNDERSAMASSQQRNRHAPRPLLIIAPQHWEARREAKMVQAALSVHPLIVGINGDPFGSTLARASLSNHIAYQAMGAGSLLPSLRPSIDTQRHAELFGDGPFCAFEFGGQSGVRHNESARAKQAVLALMQSGSLLASAKLSDSIPAMRTLGFPVRVSVIASIDGLYGPYGQGVRCINGGERSRPPAAIVIESHNASSGSEHLSQSVGPPEGALVAAFAEAGTVALQLVRRDKEALWCELTHTLGGAHRDALRCAALAQGGLHDSLQGDVLQDMPQARGAAAREQLLLGSSVYTELERGVARGELLMSAVDFGVAAHAEDLAATQLLQTAGISVVSVAIEDLMRLIIARKVDVGRGPLALHTTDHDGSCPLLHGLGLTTLLGLCG